MENASKERRQELLEAYRQFTSVYRETWDAFNKAAHLGRRPRRGRTCFVGCAAAVVAALWLVPFQADARSLEIGRSYSVGAFGGLQNPNRWNVGLQALTLHGPGDSSFIMSNLGLGLDLSYARLGEDHQLRIVPVFELLFFVIFVQVGTGAAIDLEHAERSGADLVLVAGLKLFLGDEYQAPALAAGLRIDGIVGPRSALVPSGYISLVVTIDP